MNGLCYFEPHTVFLAHVQKNLEDWGIKVGRVRVVEFRSKYQQNPDLRDLFDKWLIGN